MPGLVFGVMAALQAPLRLHGRGLRHLSAPAARVRLAASVRAHAWVWSPAGADAGESDYQPLA